MALATRRRTQRMWKLALTVTLCVCFLTVLYSVDSEIALCGYPCHPALCCTTVYLSSCCRQCHLSYKVSDTALNRLEYTWHQGRIQEFWKVGWGPVRGQSPKPSAEGRRGVWRPLSENFEKLDAISCNLAYMFGIRMASDIIQNRAFAEQKTVAATISKPTDIR